MNKTFFIGRATGDAILTETTSGVKVGRFNIAVDRNYKGADGERKTDFFPVVAFRGLAESVARYVKKGNKVAVVGSIETRSYQDGNNQKQVVMEIIAQDVEFLTDKQRPADGAADNSSGKPKLQAFDDLGEIPF